MKVAILFDDVDARADATPDERGVLEAVDAVEAALAAEGHAPVRVPVGAATGAWLGRLEREAPDVAYNLCEGVAGRADLEPHVAAVVELLGLPMTGCAAETLALCRRKDRVNALLGQAGIPVPAWTVTWPARDGAHAARVAAGWVRFPAIVKPAGEDGSVGITQASVAPDEAALGRALTAAAPFGDVLVQEFVGRREVVVGIVGDEVLPPAEIDFAALPAGLSPMVSYEAKWSAGSAEDVGTRPVCPADVSEEVEERARALAADAWRLVGGRGYGRVDFRLDEDGSLHLIEVNPNPDLAPVAGLARMADAHGWSYRELVARILLGATPHGRRQR
ncbi:MAG TPA: hypothetical protein VMK65_05425 [Longimicrobiales bacterium]|nr:hypothetical protein [Longimicrobiales bacterium]